MNFEWFFQGYDPVTDETGGTIMVGIRLDDHDSQMTFSFEADADRLSMFLQAVHRITNYDGERYRTRTATLVGFGGAELRVTGCLLEGEHGMRVADFSCTLIAPYVPRIMYSFDVYGPQDMLAFCNDGWQEIHRVKGDA